MGSSVLIALNGAKVWAYLVDLSGGLRMRLSIDEWERLQLFLVSSFQESHRPHAAASQGFQSSCGNSRSSSSHRKNCENSSRELHMIRRTSSNEAFTL